VKKVAILTRWDNDTSFHLKELQEAFQRASIEACVFNENESILSYKPDCVLVTTPQEGKLTPFPTYGLLDLPREKYLEVPRFVRNILTYDGYLTSSSGLRQLIGDLMFGARKLSSSICHFDFFAANTYKQPALDKLKKSIVIFEPDLQNTKFSSAIKNVLNKINNTVVMTFKPSQDRRLMAKTIVVPSLDKLTEYLQQYDVGIYFGSESHHDNLLDRNVIKLISAGLVTIAAESQDLKTHFNDNLFYIPRNTPLGAIHKAIEFSLAAIYSNTNVAIEKTKHAHDVFMAKFCIDNLIPNFIKFHEETLINKGYVPHPDQNVEARLPSVTYIMRTGGKHRPFLERALQCLVDQKYPDMRVIFVTHVKVPFIDEIIAQFPSIKFKVLESIKSKRSEAIRDGMAAVETDLFGLFDDDDELFPNHVRMLVKALQYHSNRDWRGEIGMVYSGSIHADDTYVVPEQNEFLDHELLPAKERRAIEHFRFYSSWAMSQHAWFMPNGWLARTNILDEEILSDPALDTCEDLYFELQIAQRRHFAFSAEVTAIHHFHHLGNSTIDDSHKHLPDTQRIALRNFGRTFPNDSNYDIADTFRLIGKQYNKTIGNGVVYQDPASSIREYDYTYNQFYPQRHRPVKAYAPMITDGVPSFAARSRVLHKLFRISFMPIKMTKYAIKFVTLEPVKRRDYLEKFKRNLKEHGLIYTIRKVDFMMHTGQISETFVKKERSTFIYKLVDAIYRIFTPSADSTKQGK